MTATAIPLVDLKAQYRAIKGEVDAAIASVLERGDFVLGQAVERFEADFAAWCGVPHALGCANGTDALHLALKALDVGPGDEVIIPAMTFVATALAVTQTGAKPVLADVDPDTALLDPNRAAKAITSRSKAILPVHLFGQLADMEALGKLAADHGLALVEDAAQAHGADRGGKRAGSFGRVAGFSFYPGKNLGAYGDGGAVATSDPALAERLKLLRNWGSVKKYHHDVIGYNSRLDTLQAAVLGVKLKHLDAWNAARRRHAAAYDAALSGCRGVTLTRSDPGSVHHLYVIRVGDRDAVLARLQAAGIGAGIHYPFAVHQLKAYGFLGYGPGSFPVAEDWARRCLSLPIYAELPEDAAARAAAVLA